MGRQCGVSVDIKRRNRSVEGLQANVQRIKEYRSKLIIFPTKNGKVGSSAEECASATQTAQLPVRQDFLFGEMDAPRAITDEEKKHSFSKLSVWPVPTRNWLVEEPSAHAKPPRLPNKLPQKRNKSDLWESYIKKKNVPGGKKKKKKKKKKKS